MHFPFSLVFIRLTKFLSLPSTFNPGLFWRHVALGLTKRFAVLGGEEEPEQFKQKETLRNVFTFIKGKRL